MFALSRLVVSLLLCLALSVSAFAAELPASGRLTPAQGMELLARQADALTILDVRTPGEFARGHFPQAVLIPVQELAARLAEVPEGPVLIVCRSGRRAQYAYELMLRSGREADQLWFLSGYTDYSGETPRFRD